MGEQKNPGDSTDFLVPQVKTPVGGRPIGSLGDYFGFPVTIRQVGAAKDVSHSALPLRAYNLIYNEWFRDQNLCISLLTPTDNGPDFHDPTYRDWETDRKSTRLNSSHITRSRMPSSA